MKILIFANSSLFVKIVASLTGHTEIVGIIIPATPNPDLASTIAYAAERQIPLLKVSEAELKESSTVGSWILNTSCDAALVLTFPFKIPSTILTIPEKGVFNLHYSQLPAYKGPDPLFWQLKNGEKQVALAVHRMTEKLDEGPIIFSKKLELFPGENYGLAKIRLTLLLQQHLPEILEKIVAAEYMETEPGVEESYHKRPQPNDLTISWEKQSAVEIENLVNAANPDYNGAITYLKGQLIRILEVSGIDGGFEAGAVLPGTIFHIDPNYGPMVLTADRQLLLINVIETGQGIFSGKKFCAMGIKQGDKFTEFL